MSESSERRPPTIPPPAPAGVPAPKPISRPPADRFEAEDRTFVAALREAGLCSELENGGFDTVRREVGTRRGLARRVDILEQYYKPRGDAQASKRRIAADGFFLHREDEPVNAHGLVKRFVELVPELPPVALERIGGGADGPLVLRCGDHIVAVVDDYEDDLETGEVDLRDIEEGPPTISLLGIVRAVNVLLDRNSIRYRFVPIACDSAREVYVTTTVAEAIALANGGYLELENAEEVIDLASW